MRSPIQTSLVALFGLLLAASPVLAVPVVYDLGMEFSGATPPSGTGPWLRATFENSSSDVVLTLESLNLQNSEFVSGWYFNYTGDLDSLSIVGSPTNVEFDSDNLKADGDGEFDIKFTWGNCNRSRVAHNTTSW